MPNSSKFNAIVNARCPQCHQGRLFKFKWWNLLNFTLMHARCPICNLRYEVEPGFFFGAMYISYAFTVGIMLVGGLIIYYFFNDPMAAAYILPITLFSLIMVPFNFRTARVLYIHWFSGVRYNKNAILK